MLKKLSELQNELRCPKSQYNRFGNYSYRSCEDVLESLKPLLVQYGLTLTISDEIVQIGDRYYVKATATVRDTESDKSISVSAYAREPLESKGMSEPQITGSASSYSRKYALNALFLIDDVKDSDTDEAKIEADARTKKQAAPRKNPEAPEPKNEKITAKEVEIIKNMCERAGKKAEVIFPKGVENLTASQYTQAIQTLTGWIQKAEGK